MFRDLSGLSADALDQLAKKAKALADDLRKAEPSDELALENGITNCGYSTVRWGWVSSFRGEAIVEMTDGRRWKCVGHGPRGDAEFVSRQGWIEKIPLA
jgi:hypothetical protein